MRHAWDILEEYRGTLFEGEWPSICHMFLITLRRYPERPAFTVIEGNAKHSLTYAQIARRIGGLAAFLHSRGIVKGDRVILNGKNSPAWAMSYLGIIFSGAIVVPLDNQMGSDRVDALSAFSQAKGIFADRDVLDRLEEGSWLATQDLIVSLDGAGDDTYRRFASIKESDGPLEELELPSGEDIAAILYTSGTTGNE
ncbi:MAG: AMP-binding protein, partial [Sphaerochaetaceae bacterium]